MQLSETVKCLSAELTRLSTGQLAELRRVNVNGPGAASFWLLAAKCKFIDARTDEWMQIVKIMAILMPKGERTKQRELHDAKRPLGAVLCDGGNPAWPPAGEGLRPFTSEARLARVLSQRPDQRSQALVRFARMLAPNRDPESGVNCEDVAALLLYTDRKRHLKDLARTYYQRLDIAARKAESEETNA